MYRIPKWRLTSKIFWWFSDESLWKLASCYGMNTVSKYKLMNESEMFHCNKTIRFFLVINEYIVWIQCRNMLIENIIDFCQCEWVSPHMLNVIHFIFFCVRCVFVRLGMIEYFIALNYFLYRTTYFLASACYWHRLQDLNGTFSTFWSYDRPYWGFCSFLVNL